MEARDGHAMSDPASKGHTLEVTRAASPITEFPLFIRTHTKLLQSLCNAPPNQAPPTRRESWPDEAEKDELEKRSDQDSYVQLSMFVCSFVNV